MKFKCATCGKLHDLSEISFGADAPVQWSLVTDGERARSELTPEQCVLESSEGRHFFVRACLEIPIKESGRNFTWGVWVSLSEKSFSEMSAHWDDPERTKLGPYFGWLCTKVPEYPDTVFLKTHVHQRPVGFRPLVELEATDHPLAVHQREGIGPAEMEAIVARVLHPGD
jgi:hypothetical protein